LGEELQCLQATIPDSIISRKEGTPQGHYQLGEDRDCLLDRPWSGKELLKCPIRNEGVGMVSLQKALKAVYQEGVVVKFYTIEITGVCLP